MDWVNQTIRTNSNKCKDMRVETIQERQQLVLDLVVEKDIPEKLQYQNVIGIDMGIRHIATSVELANGLTKFYGKDLSRVRSHYFCLRRKLGIKKAIIQSRR
jgi:putative transposase